MRIIAFDLSLTATGYATPERVGVLTPAGDAVRGVQRLRWIRDQVLRLVEGADLVVLEGYSFASRGRAIVSIGELGGVVRLALFEAGHIVVEVPPACRAKYATGRGNACKEEVLAAAIRRLGYGGHSFDEADALWLRAMACEQYGTPLVEMPQAHRAALQAVRWPSLDVPRPARAHGSAVRDGTFSKFGEGPERPVTAAGVAP